MKNQKLSKSVLKDIVKECLIEILSEGLVSGTKTSSKSRRQKSETLKESLISSSRIQKSESKPNFKKPSYLDSINFNQEEKIQNTKLDEIASSVTSDPVLSEMLMDTAHTTLQEQIAAESKKSYMSTGAGDPAQKVVAASSPEDLFGDETASKWAALAFNS